MKRNSPTASCASESSLEIRRRSIPTDRVVASRDRNEVDRWMAMINAELNADDDHDRHEASGGAVSTPTRIERTNSISPLRDQETVEVTIEFGRTFIEASAQRIEVGALVRLDQTADEPVDLVVAGQTVARGELITVDGKLGVRVVEILMLFLLGFFALCETSHAEERERVREQAPRRTVKFDADESDAESFVPKSLNRKQAEPLRMTQPTKTAELFESDVSLSRERSPKVLKSESVSLSPPSASRLNHTAKESTDNADRSSRGETVGWGSTIWPLLAVVVAIVIGSRWLKTHSSVAVRGLPSEAFDVLGRRAIDQRTSVVMARCGSRLLVLSLSSNGLQTLSEITDPVEVDCLAGLCRMTQRDQSLAETFRAMLHKPESVKAAATKPLVTTQSHSPQESRWPDRLLTEDLATAPLREERR